MSKKKKPELNQEAITDELLDKVAAFYSSPRQSAESFDGDVEDSSVGDGQGEQGKNGASLREVAKEFNISILKAKKLLITAGVYPMTEQISLIQYLKKQDMTEKQIADRLGVTVSAVNAVLPYEKVVYKLDDGKGRTVEADRVDLYRKRWKSVEFLKEAVEDMTVAADGVSWREALWNCINLFQGYEFVTAGRGKTHSGSTPFTYELKRSSRTGGATDELVISGRTGKTVTRSSVELALKRYLEVMEERGYVKGPKAVEVFGGSYLYSIFLKWGVIWLQQGE